MGSQSNQTETSEGLQSVRMKLPNSFRIALSRVWNHLFEHWWNFYYKYGSRCPPKKFYYQDWIEDPETYEWDYLHYGEFYEPTCFPLIFKINCLACRGCKHVHDPPLSPDKHKGPYKIVATDQFCKQYEELFGKEALVHLLYELEKQN